MPDTFARWLAQPAKSRSVAVCGRLPLTIALLLVCGWSAVACGQGSGLVGETLALRHGLTRAWYARMSIDGTNEKVTHATLDRGMLFVQTSGGVVHALDAETGRAMWIMQAGRGDRATVAPGASSKQVAVANGSTLYVLDRQTGQIDWTRKLRSSPGAGPVLTDSHVFVPLVDGMLEGYALGKKDRQMPWIYQSVGRVFAQPFVTAESIGWTTDRGYFYVANADPMKIRARLQTRAAIESRPGYWTPYFYTTSVDGYVYAIHERSAETAWRFSAADPILEAPVAINGRVYVVPETGGMFCLDGAQGTQLWFAPGVSEFVAASPTRLYTIDRSQRMLILDVATGARLDLMPLDASLRKLHNEQSDRIYLIGSNGLVQCLHEVGLPKPTTYTPPPLPEVDSPMNRKKKDKEKPKDEAAEGAAGDQKPGDEPAEAADKDKMMDDAKPGAKPEEDPFK